MPGNASPPHYVGGYKYHCMRFIGQNMTNIGRFDSIDFHRWISIGVNHSFYNLIVDEMYGKGTVFIEIGEEGVHHLDKVATSGDQDHKLDMLA